MKKYPLRTYIKNRPHSPCIEYIHPYFQKVVQTVIDFAESEENTFFDKIILFETNVKWEWDCRSTSKYSVMVRLAIVFSKKIDYSTLSEEELAAGKVKMKLLSYVREHCKYLFNPHNASELSMVDYENLSWWIFEFDHLYDELRQRKESTGIVIYERPGGRLCGN